MVELSPVMLLNEIPVIAPAAKPPEASLATIVDTPFAELALLVTVNVAPVDWFAVKVWAPERPTPETARVSVALFTVGSCEVSARVPVVAGRVRTVPVPAMAVGRSWIVPDVEPGRVTLEIPVRARFAVVRFSATDVVPINTAELPRTVEVRVPVTFAAGRLVSAAPDPEKVAVMVPAEKFPLASRWTT